MRTLALVLLPTALLLAAFPFLMATHERPVPRVEVAAPKGDRLAPTLYPTDVINVLIVEGQDEPAEERAAHR